MKKKTHGKKKEIYRKLENLPIRMVLTILLFPFFLLLLICYVAFYSSGTREYTGLVKKNAKAVVEQCRNSLNQDFIEIQDNADGLVSQRAFYTMKNNIEEGKPPIEPVDYLQMTSSFTSFLQHYSTYIDTVGLYLSDNSIYYIQSNTGAEQDIMRNLDYEELKKYANSWMWVVVSDVLPQNVSELLPYNLALIYPLGSERSPVQGCLWIGIRNDTYLNTIASSKVTISSKMNLLRKDGILISENDIQKSEKDLSAENLTKVENKIKHMKESEIAEFDLEDLYVVYSPLVLGDMGILTVIPKNELYVDFTTYKYVFIFFISAAIVIFVILYFVIPRYFSEPVTKLLKQMEKIRKPEEYQKIQVSGYSEISEIGNGVNEMMDRILALTESIQREMKAKQATQLQYLFAQINPHFLYNTLDCIKELCLCNETEKAGEMINQLVIFYRIGVSKGKSFILLEEELRHVSAYLSILQTRFEDFQFEIHVAEELKKSVVPRMILQPIAENALYHGIRPYRMDGTIRICAEKCQNNMKITVSDDGGGIPEDVLMKISKSLDEPICDYSKESYNVYGLKNVQDRIQIAYGKEYKIYVKTETDCGTDVMLTLPYEEVHK